MPSLYETTAIVGDVSSSNFTTLYNSSGLSAPNSGGGAISGNLNVAGNLTVQGASLLQGAVTLGSTLSTPNYTFPLPDGTTDQVLVTDGSGNLYWTDVSAIPGAAYSIEANTATGGANLTLVDSAGGTDSVKFAGGTNITVSRTDGNTITISTVADNIPDGTASGQVLTWNGTAWTANNLVTSLAAADRLTPEFKSTDTTRGSSAIFRRNYASTAYTAGLPSGIAFSFDSDSQVPTTQGAVGTLYDTDKPSIFGSTSIDNFTNSVRVFDIDSTDVRFAAGNIVLNFDHTGAATDNASITVERGTDPDATITWNETTDRFEFSNSVYTAVNLAAAGNVALNRDASDANAVIVFYKPTTGTEIIQWDKTDNRFELSNDTFIDGDLTVNGNDIKSSTGLTAITLDNNSVIVAGDVTVSGQDIKSNGGTTAITLNGADVTVVGDLAVNGGDITTTSTTGNLFNTNATVVNIGNAASTEVNIGSSTGGSRVQIKSATVVGNNTTQNVFDTVATTVNAFGAATAVNIGAATGVTTIEHDLTVQGGNINLNGAATAGVQPFITFANQPDGVNSMYGIRGKSSVDDPWFVGAGSTGDDLGYLEIATGDNTGDPFGVASPIYVRQYNGFGGNQVPWYGGTATVVHELTLLDGNGNTVIPNNVTINGDLAVNGGDITTTSTTGNLFNNDGVTTVNVGNGATTEVNLGRPGAGRVQVKSTELDLNGGLLVFRSETTGAPALNAEIRVERGTSADASLTWDESQDRWEFNNALEVQGQITGTSNLDLNGNQIALRSGATVDGDASILVDNGTGLAVIKWDSGTDRWQTSVDNVTYLNIPNQNLDLTSDVTFSSVNIDGAAVTNTFATTRTSTAQFTVDQTLRNTIKAMVFMTRGADTHALEILIMRTSTDAMITTYGEMYSSTPLATFTADQSGGQIRILATPTSATSTTFSTVRTALT